MLREQTMTFVRGIPEFYISSDKDIHLKTSFTDWMAKFVARRRALASNQVRFDKKILFPTLKGIFNFYLSCRSSFRQEVGLWRHTATPLASTPRYCLRTLRTTSADVLRSSRAASSSTQQGPRPLKRAKHVSQTEITFNQGRFEIFQIFQD